jgi:hypothetical protein
MQPADRSGATRDQLVMTARQQTQDPPVIFANDVSQIPMA